MLTRRLFGCILLGLGVVAFMFNGRVDPDKFDSHFNPPIVALVALGLWATISLAVKICMIISKRQIRSLAGISLIFFSLLAVAAFQNQRLGLGDYMFVAFINTLWISSWLIADILSAWPVLLERFHAGSA